VKGGLFIGARARRVVTLAVGVLAVSAGCAVASASGYGAFGNPQPVTIEGYSGSGEEPFITRDGAYLLFNSSEAMPNFALQLATRVNAQTFEYLGEIEGEHVNEPTFLSGTPSLDEEGNLYFISNRSYAETLSTVYTGKFSHGIVTNVHLAPGVSGEVPGKVDFDVDVSPDGAILYVSVGQFGPGGGPTSASVVMFDRVGAGFVRDPRSAKVLKAVNQVGAINYAANPSSDGLELFFTAASPTVGGAPGIYRATRASTGRAFGAVERISAITGFSEAPSITSDGTTLYFHKQVGSEFKIETVTRTPSAPTITNISPNRGPAGSQTPVTITGAGLDGAISVAFGAASAVSFTQSSPTSISAIAPAGVKGTVSVTVTTPGGTNVSSKKARFKYVR
jgi:IPT/TIG domain/WD40-like Beta Propeller Repeat